MTPQSETSSARPAGRICVLVPLVHDLYFSGILSGVAEAAHERGLELVLAPTQHEHAREAAILDGLGDADGAIIILPEETADELELVQSQTCPLVVIDPLMPLGDRISTVGAAHASGAGQAMRHLLELGHRRIGAIAGPPGWEATEQRRAAYHAALASAGIAPDPDLLVESDFELAPGAAAAGELLDLRDPPTAIFGFNDATAIGAMHAAAARGLRVPDDLSIVGFDDIRYATLVRPALTTVRQPLGEMGSTGLTLLLGLIGGRGAESRQIELPTRLIVRESTAPQRRVGTR